MPELELMTAPGAKEQRGGPAGCTAGLGQPEEG